MKFEITTKLALPLISNRGAFLLLEFLTLPIIFIFGLVVTLEVLKEFELVQNSPLAEVAFKTLLQVCRLLKK